MEELRREARVKEATARLIGGEIGGGQRRVQLLLHGREPSPRVNALAPQRNRLERREILGCKVLRMVQLR